MEILMKLSARNQLKGKIVAVTKGQTTAHVRIDIGGGVIVTASITNEAVDDLGLRAGALAALALPSRRVDAKPFTDAAGRRIDVPDQVRRVFPAGPPAAVT